MTGGALHGWSREMPADAACGLRVLASGSRGNCSVLVTNSGNPRVSLIDAGLSPSRTRKILAGFGIEPWQVDDILLTHLDQDHLHPGWTAALRTTRWRATLRIAERHMGRAERSGVLINRAEAFDGGRFEMGGVIVDPVMLSHDSLGVAAFRISAPSERGVGVLGFATDLGRVTGKLIETMRGVDVLAIESNYCRRMQVDSDRPAFLKRRIMNGSGHLSNDESSEAVLAIGPRSRVVLLHLSQECNRPEVALAAHARARVPVVATDQHEASEWVWVDADASRRVAAPEVVMRTMPLFGRAGESVA